MPEEKDPKKESSWKDYLPDMETVLGVAKAVSFSEGAIQCNGYLLGVLADEQCLYPFLHRLCFFWTGDQTVLRRRFSIQVSRAKRIGGAKHCQ